MQKKYERISYFLSQFLQQEVKKTGLSKVVVGLSGGLDSAVVAVLAQKVFGNHLLTVKMPSHYSSQSSLNLSVDIPIGSSVTLTLSEFLLIFP